MEPYAQLLKSSVKFIFFFLTVNTIYAQYDTIVIQYPKEPLLIPEHDNDTLLIDTPMDGTILFGTTKLPNTSNQTLLYSYGLWLDKVSGSQCSNDFDPEYYKADNMSALSITDSTWIIDLQITANCCHFFLGDASLEEDSILNLIYYGYGGAYCACLCCFGINYTFLREDFEDYDKIRYIMINDDRKTLIKIKFP